MIGVGFDQNYNQVLCLNELLDVMNMEAIESKLNLCCVSLFL